MAGLWINVGDGKAWVIRAADMFTCLECLMDKSRSTAIRLRPLNAGHGLEE